MVLRARPRHLIAFAALFTSLGSANYLSYVDEKGTRHVVGTEDEIPERFRTKAKKSKAGDDVDSYIASKAVYVPDPKDSPRARCEKEADFHFENVKKKIFETTGEDDGLGADAQASYGQLVAKHNGDRSKCASLKGTAAPPPAETEAPKLEPLKLEEGF